MFILVESGNKQITTKEFNELSKLVDYLRAIDIDCMFFQLINGETVSDNGFMFKLLEVRNDLI